MNIVLDVLGKWLRRLAIASSAVGGSVMVLMLVIVIINIVLRPFGGTIRGTVEISGYLCALAVGLCMPAAQLAGSHIAAGLWAASLPRVLRRLQKGASNLLCATLLFLVAQQLFGIAEYAVEMEEYIEGFNISFYVMALGFAFGSVFHAAIFLYSLARGLFPVKTEGA